MIKIPNPYFSNVPGVGDLELCDIFYALERPILFLCKDNNNQLYLCSCCKLYPRLEWIISSIEPEIVIDLIDDKILIAKALSKGEKKFFAVWEQGDACERIQSVKKYDDTMLGDDDDYLDVEDGEFDDIKQKMENWTESTSDTVMENIISMKKSIPKVINYKSFLISKDELHTETLYSIYNNWDNDWDDREESIKTEGYYQTVKQVG